MTLDNEDDAYLIFETLNTRGKDLALSDLMRNHFTKFLKPVGGVDQSKLKWGKVLDTIASSTVNLDPDTFIVHSWQSRYDFVTKAKTFQKVKAAVTQKNAKSHLDRFVTDSEQWRAIFDTEYMWDKNEKDIARSLSALRVFKVVQPAPGLLSLVRAYRDGVIKYKVAKKAVHQIEKFHFAFNAITSSRSSGGISGMYSSFGRSVFTAKDSNEVAMEITNLLEKLRDREVPESEFDAGFEQIIYLLLVDSETNGLLGTHKFVDKKKILLARGYRLPDAFLSVDKLTPELIVENTKRISVLARQSIWKV